MRGASIVLAVVFVVAAGVQLNDPDPLRWIVGYLVAAALSVMAAMGRARWQPNALAALAFGLWFLTLAPTLWTAESAAFTSFQMKAERHEEPREAVGLALCTVWCAALAVWAARGRDPSMRE
jgi:hypothetical protein